MTVSFGLGALRAEWPRAVACVGTFDGVHLGHRAVIGEAARQAQEAELPLVLATFDRHPAAVLAPDRCPKALAPLEENLRQFEALGVSATVILPFDRAMADMSADTFLESVLKGALKSDRLVVGHDFAMGHGRVGTAEWLAERLPTTIVPPFELDGIRVSSSRIRKAVGEGNAETATRLLGRPFVLSGVVIGGQKLGRTLGFPTANLARTIDGVVPADGVYASWFHAPRGRFPAALAIGTRPAVGGGPRSIEAYLLDYDGASLYGQACRVEVVAKLRDEWDFPSLDALVEQIRRDVEQVRSALGEREEVR
jgi:riboflavin kinase/FMN adenylyltransferase